MEEEPQTKKDFRTAEEILEGYANVLKTKRKLLPNRQQGKVGLYLLDPKRPPEGSRARTFPYGIKIAVILLRTDSRHGRIIISVDPKSNYDFAKREIIGINFSGSARSSGSPRNKKYDKNKARMVFNYIASNLENFVSAEPNKRTHCNTD